MRPLRRLAGLVFIGLAFSPGPTFAWGERGHAVICEVASRLVSERGLQSFALSKGQVLGHLCNVPDIHWKDLGELSQSGEATHFVNPEKIGLFPATLPLRWSEVEDLAKKNRRNAASDVGSLYWRADQFVRMATEAGKRVPTKKPKKGDEQDPAQPYNRAVYDMMVAMGLLGHFVGDASMPYHNTTDYDGWKKGRGGIHRFYEKDCLDAIPLSLLEDVWKQAQGVEAKPDKVGAAESVVELMRSLSALSYSEIEKIEALDQIVKPSLEVGKIVAVRPSAEKAAEAFRPLITLQLARAARLMAAFWDRIYRDAGRPDLSSYRLYLYPLAPEFVPPDYIKTKR